MLAFDIETTGLDRKSCEITIVCAEDFVSGRVYNYEFSKARAEGSDIAALTKKMIEDFDAAPSLCAFNGVRFDLPFFVTLGVPEEKIALWIIKTTDILEQCRLRGLPTFGLNMLCAANGIQLKSSDGKQAITMASNCQWDALREYCADDVKILCNLYKQRFVKHPRNNQLLDLRDWAHVELYSKDQANLQRHVALSQSSPSSGSTTETDKCVSVLTKLVHNLSKIFCETEERLKSASQTPPYIN